jgi:hypothetical protein
MAAMYNDTSQILRSYQRHCDELRQRFEQDPSDRNARLWEGARLYLARLREHHDDGPL